MTSALAAALQLHHVDRLDLADRLETVTHGLPRCEWPPCAGGLLWALCLRGTTKETTT